MAGRPGVMVQVRTKPVQDTMSNVDSVIHEVGCTEICGVSPIKNQSGKRLSEENLENDSPYCGHTALVVVKCV